MKEGYILDDWKDIVYKYINAKVALWDMIHTVHRMKLLEYAMKIAEGFFEHRIKQWVTISVRITNKLMGGPPW